LSSRGLSSLESRHYLFPNPPLYW